VVERPGGATHDVGATASETTFAALTRGRHFFEVTALYTGGVRVTATPSNTVSVLQPRYEHHHHRSHHGHGRYHSHDRHTPEACRAGARF
jgi:hypothetical protein